MDAQVSLEFYRYLCDVIGTKEVVKARRQIFHPADNTDLNSGSKAEGLDLSGSDLDIMFIIRFCSVYESSNEVDHSLCTIPLIMDVNDTCPGFTKLYVSGDPRCHSIDKCSVFIKNKQYISSALIKTDFFKYVRVPLFDHGPCVCPNDQFDFAITLHCNKWISDAKDFITRTQFSWASKGVLETILQFGVLFVPIGSKRSPDTDLEWRISFSFAEKLLIWSFNHEQLLCYALLKILLREVIRRKMPDSSADLLCSYFLKTIMFWLCEETDVLQWKPETLLSCFNMAFKRLLYCVENKTLLHYFIPENNLFKDRFTNEQYKALMSNLTDLLNIGWTCLLDTEILKSFRERITSSLALPDILTVSYLPCLPISLIGRIGLQDTIDMHSSVYLCIRSCKNTLFLYQFSNINLTIGQNMEADEGDSNKGKYNRYRKQLCHFLMGTNHDAVSGWLLLASFFLRNKQYFKSQHLIDFCLSKLSGHDQNMIFPDTVTREGEHQFNRIRSKLGPSNKGDYFACKYFTAMRVYTKVSQLNVPDNFTVFYPDQFEQFRAISPLIFANYIKFLCDRQFGNIRDIHDICKSIKDLQNIVSSIGMATTGDVVCVNHVVSLCKQMLDL